VKGVIFSPQHPYPMSKMISASPSARITSDGAGKGQVSGVSAVVFAAGESEFGDKNRGEI
jgi:hypothetical protein